MRRRIERGLGILAGLVAGSFALAAPAGATALFEHEFVSSSTGTTTIGLGDTITFESFITIEAGTPVSAVVVSYTGDIDASLATPTPCPGGAGEPCFVDTAHHVTDWVLAGSSAVPTDLLGVAHVQGPERTAWLDAPVLADVNLGDPVFQAFSALFGRYREGSFYEGTGQRSLIGTVTITADAYGVFDAGALIYPGITGVYSAVSRFETGVVDVVEIESTVIPMSFVSGAFSVVPVPEPTTALMLGGGLFGLGLASRRTRR